MTWLLVALATYRLTRLVTTDTLSAPAREWVQARYDRLGYLVGCDWCSSMWLAPGPVLLGVLAPNSEWTLIVLGIPSISAAVGIMATLLEPSEDSSH
jgi:hypothetical protein